MDGWILLHTNCLVRFHHAVSHSCSCQGCFMSWWVFSVNCYSWQMIIVKHLIELLLHNFVNDNTMLKVFISFSHCDCVPNGRVCELTGWKRIVSRKTQYRNPQMPLKTYLTATLESSLKPLCLVTNPFFHQTLTFHHELSNKAESL